MFSYCIDAIVAKVQNIFDCSFYKLILETLKISCVQVKSTSSLRKLALLVCTGFSVFICVIMKGKRKMFQPKADWNQ